MSVVELSKKLFVLPNVRILIILYLILVSILFFYSFRAFIFLILLTATAFVSIKLLKLRFNLKRVLFLSILASLLSLSSFALSGSFAGSFFLFLSVIYFCSERGFLPAVVASSIPYLLIDLNSIVAILISSVLFYLYLKTMEIRVKNSTMREFVESFVKFWLTNDPRYAEEILAKNSEIFEGRVRCLSINDFRLISTDFHPGPFRNVGGAKLVNFLDFPNAVYLHSPSNHDRDPVSEEDLEQIRESVRCNEVDLKPKKPFELESENFKVFCIPFDKKKVIFISGKRRIDDFVIESKEFVVDCHNANFFGDLETWEVEEIEELVKKAESMESGAASVRGAVLKMRAETESISRYVATILLDYGERYAIVVFDSNNIDPDFRKIVERKFEELGFKAIVCSTDNHWKTGLRVKESYKPAGACKNDSKLLEILVEMCKGVKFEPLSFKYGETFVKIRVLGSVREKIENLASTAGKHVYLFFFLIFICWLLSVSITKAI